jgi:hypothetical protein
LPRRRRAYPSTGLDEFREVYAGKSCRVKEMFELKMVAVESTDEQLAIPIRMY